MYYLVSELSGSESVKRTFSAIIESEDGGFVSFCPELDIASQGDTVEEARDHLREAVTLFFEHASKDEIRRRLGEDIS